MKYLMMAIFLFVVGSTSSQLKERDNLLGISLGFWPTNNAPVLGVNY